MNNPTSRTPEQVAARLHELAAEIPRHAMPREQIAEGFRLIAEAIAPAALPVDGSNATTA